MKIAIDTNILIRMITQDDEQMVKRARGLIDQHGPKDVFICHGVLLEAFYVLTKKYGLSVEEALSSFEDLLKVEQFSFEYETPIRLAISKCLKGSTFNDALFGEIGASRNLKTHTFDKGLKNNKSFEVI